jgi:hypothetical protein
MEWETQISLSSYWQQPIGPGIWTKLLEEGFKNEYVAIVIIQTFHYRVRRGEGRCWISI